MLIEHEPWIGKSYSQGGWAGARVLIVGFSHHRESPDYAGYTVDTLKEVISGASSLAFFNQIKNYFSAADHAEFWEKVMFINYLPDCVGLTDNRFGYGTDDQHFRAKSRFLKLLELHKPHKAMIFTTKGWNSLPPTDEERLSNKCRSFEKPFPLNFEHGTYTIAGNTTYAYGLRHPQGAGGELMHNAVSFALRHSWG